MQPPAQTAKAAKATMWAGCGLSVFALLFLLFDSITKLIDLSIVQESIARLGYAANLDRAIGIVELACLILYAIPRTSKLGGTLLTGLFSDEIASPAFDPLLPNVEKIGATQSCSD